MYWKVDEQAGVIHLVLVGKTLGWLGFGLSEHGAVSGSDFVIAWVDSDGKAHSQDRWAKDYKTTHLDDCQDWHAVHGIERHGFTTVHLRRKLKTADSHQDREFVKSANQYIVHASGKTDKFTHWGSKTCDCMGFQRMKLFGPDDPYMFRGTRNLPEDATSYDLTTPFKMPHTGTNILCTAYDLKKMKGKTIIGADPVISGVASNNRIHHMVLHLCKNNRHFKHQMKHPKTACAPPSFLPNSGCVGGIWGYQPGEGRTVYPEGVGMKVGDGEDEVQYLIMEQHYDNPHHVKETAIDHSGVRFWFSDTPRKYTPTMTVMADPFSSALMKVPPHTANYEAQFLCPRECTVKLFSEPTHVFMASQHAHMNAQRIVTTVKRKSTGETETIDFNNFFQHSMQRLTNVNITIYPGDELITRCVYTNDNAEVPIRMGSNTYNEMCMQFLMFYPRAPSQFLCGYRDPHHLFCGESTNLIKVDKIDGRKLEETFNHDTDPSKWGNAKQCAA
jgi:hypothetical protein